MIFYINFYILPSCTKVQNTKKSNSFLNLISIIMHESSSRFISGADEENRTPVISLEGWGSTIELHPQLVDNINYTIF